MDFVTAFSICSNYARAYAEEGDVHEFSVNDAEECIRHFDDMSDRIRREGLFSLFPTPRRAADDRRRRQ